MSSCEKMPCMTPATPTSPIGTESSTTGASKRFSGRVAIVTGSTADPSIGRSCALRLAREGASVVVNGRNTDRVAATEAASRNVEVLDETLRLAAMDIRGGGLRGELLRRVARRRRDAGASKIRTNLAT